MTSAPPAALASALDRLARGRDEAAWSALVDAFGADLARTCAAVAGAELGEDALHETLLRLRDRAGRFAPPPDGDAEAAARGWARRVATTTSLELVRARRRAARREADTPPGAPVDDPSDVAARRERDALVRRELAALPTDQREAVTLHYLLGAPLAEVAAAQGIAHEAAKKRAQRGAERLRRRLVRAGVALSVPALATRLGQLAADEIAFHPARALDAFARPAAAAPIGAVKGIAMAVAIVLPFAVIAALIGAEPPSTPLPAGTEPPPATDAADQELAWFVRAAPLLARPVARDLGDARVADVAAALSDASGLEVAIAPELAAATPRLRFAESGRSTYAALERVADMLEGGVRMTGPRSVRIVALPADPTQAWGRQELTLAFTDIPLADALAQISDASGIAIMIDRDVADPPPVTLRVERMRVRNVLDFIAALTGLHWQHRGDGSILVSRAAQAPTAEDRVRALAAAAGAARRASIESAIAAASRDEVARALATTVTVAFERTPFEDAVARLREQSHANIVVAPEIYARGGDPRVTIAGSMTAEAALRAIGEQVGFRVVNRDRAAYLAPADPPSR